MNALSLMFVAVLGLFVLVGPAQAVVARVVVVQTTDEAAYMKQIERIRAANQRLGNKETVRVWRARYAGEASGSIVVAVEYADLAALAASNEKQRTDPEFQAILKELAGLRKIVSDSLYEEMK
jgi:hypothetical protein